MGHWTLAPDQFQQVTDGFAYLLSNTDLAMEFTNKQTKMLWELYYQWKVFISLFHLETPFVSLQEVDGIISEMIKIVQLISTVSLNDF